LKPADTIVLPAKFGVFLRSSLFFTRFFSDFLPKKGTANTKISGISLKIRHTLRSGAFRDCIRRRVLL